MKKIYIILMTLITMFLIGCNQKSETVKTDKKEKKIVVAQTADAKSLDPQNSNDTRSGAIIPQIFDTLVKTDEKMNILPSIAEKWETIDDLTTRFYIRKNVTFHNGENLTVEDIKYSVNRMQNSPVVGHIAKAIDRVEIVNENSIDIITKYPFSPLLSHLSHTAASIVNKKAVESSGDTFGQNPIGTGPFIFKSWQAGSQIDLVKNDNYFLSAPKIDKLVFRAIPENTNRVIALETKEIDVSYNVSPIDISIVNNNKDLSILLGDPLGIQFLGFNTQKAPFDNKDLRKAISYALDVEPILKSVLEGYGKNNNGPISAAVFGYSEDRIKYNRNLETAKEYLKNAGYENGLSVELWIDENPDSIQIAQIIQDQLKDINVNVSLQTLEWGAFLQRVSKGEHQMFTLGWTTVTGDSDYGLSLFHSSSKGGAGNRFFYENKEVDELLDSARKEKDSEKRKNAYAKVQNLIQDDAVMGLSYTKTIISGVNNRVKGFVLHPAGKHSFLNVDVD